MQLIRTSRFLFFREIPALSLWQLLLDTSIVIAFLHCFVLEIEQGQPSGDIYGQGSAEDSSFSLQFSFCSPGSFEEVSLLNQAGAE